MLEERRVVKVVNGMEVLLIVVQNARRTSPCLIYTSVGLGWLPVPYCNSILPASMHVQTVQARGVIGSSLKLEMKNRHRVDTLALCILVATRDVTQLWRFIAGGGSPSFLLGTSW